jgi:hypothetical protein
MRTKQEGWTHSIGQYGHIQEAAGREDDEETNGVMITYAHLENLNAIVIQCVKYFEAQNKQKRDREAKKEKQQASTPGKDNKLVAILVNTEVVPTLYDVWFVQDKQGKKDKQMACQSFFESLGKIYQQYFEQGKTSRDWLSGQKMLEWKPHRHPRKRGKKQNTPQQQKRPKAFKKYAWCTLRERQNIRKNPPKRESRAQEAGPGMNQPGRHRRTAKSSKCSTCPGPNHTSKSGRGRNNCQIEQSIDAPRPRKVHKMAADLLKTVDKDAIAEVDWGTAEREQKGGTNIEIGRASCRERV